VPIDAGAGVKFVWIIISLVSIETFNTLYSTPYVALGTDISRNYNDRTRIQISKTIFFLIGMVVPSVLLYIFLPNTAEYPVGQLNPQGYKYISAVTSIICLISGITCIFFVNNSKKLKTNSNSTSLKSMFSSFAGALKIKPILTIVLGYAIVMLSATILTSVGMHFFTYCFNLTSSQITILLSALLVGNLISQPLWYYASTKKDKKSALLRGIFVSVVGVFLIITIFLLRLTLGSSAFWYIMVAILVSGIGSGALYTLPASIFSDAIIKVNSLTKNDKTATYSGVMTFASNIVNSVFQLLIGVSLDVIKFNPNNTIQSLSVQTGLAIILFVGIQISLITGYYIFSKYRKITLKDI